MCAGERPFQLSESAALKHHRLSWRPPQKGEGKVWGQGRMGRLCLESNKSRRLGGRGEFLWEF